MPPLPTMIAAGEADATHLLKTLAQGTLGLTVNPNPVLPGQPLQVEWSVSIFGTQFAATATARILIGTTAIYSSDATAFTSASPLPHMCTASGATTINPTPNDPGGRDLYAFGTRTLTLEVTYSTDRPGATPRRTTATVDIVPEAVDGSWWAWTAPPVSAGWAQVNWGSTYSVDGTLTNRSIYATLTGSLIINEFSRSNSGGLQRASGMIPALTPGATFNATSQPILWNNGNDAWLSAGGVAIFFSEQSYSYACEFTAQDAYGNPYSQTTSAALNVDVRVPDGKLYSGQSAGIATFSAIGLAISAAALLAGVLTAPAAPAFAAAAGVATALAAAAYGVAIDPIEIDPAYPVVPALPDLPSIPQEAQALCGPITQCLQAMRAVATIAIVDGRVAGAEEAQDDSALLALKERRVELQKLATESIDSAAAALDAAIAEVMKVEAGPQDSLIRQTFLEGSSDPLAVLLNQAGISDRWRAILPSVVRWDYVQIATTPVSTLLTALTYATIQATQALLPSQG